MRLTKDFDWNGLRGHLAKSGNGFAFVSERLPPIPVLRGAALLDMLSNEDIIRHDAGVCCRERISPYSDEFDDG